MEKSTKNILTYSCMLCQIWLTDRNAKQYCKWYQIWIIERSTKNSIQSLTVVVVPNMNRGEKWFEIL